MASISWQQTALIDDLLETIEESPTSLDARVLLIEQYEALGWRDAAADQARHVLELFPDAPETTALLNRYDIRGSAKLAKKARKRPVKSATPSKHSALDVQHLGVEYVVLQDDAKALLQELSVLAHLAPGTDCAKSLATLTALAEGRMFSVAKGKCGKSGGASSGTSAGALRSARAVAASMTADAKNSLLVAITDLEAILHRPSATNETVNSKDVLREGLRKRVDAVRSALPAAVSHHATDALMHVEHEKLDRSYKNKETMLGDPVSAIPRENFWASEDGYAWDMDELAQAIQANKGAMRNPLTKEMFSADDVAAIVRHPKGKKLAAIEVEQNELKKGVRTETIARLKTMSGILLVDMSENSQPSHEAIDGFLLYVATLPQAERTAIDKLRVPAFDSHTRQPFDDTIGDAVRDAKGNRLCFHKAGDLLAQAANFLSNSETG